jgi:hypothetical protein
MIRSIIDSFVHNQSMLQWHEQKRHFITINVLVAYSFYLTDKKQTILDQEMYFLESSFAFTYLVIPVEKSTDGNLQ